MTKNIRLCLINHGARGGNNEKSHYPNHSFSGIHGGIFEEAHANNSPTITGTPATTALQDTPYSFEPIADDPDLAHGDVLTFEIITTDPATLPTWLTLDTATGKLWGTPLTEHVGTKISGMVITVRDSAGLSAVLDSFDITVEAIEYAIRTEVTGVGGISPSSGKDKDGNDVHIIVAKGSDPTFTVTPHVGYELASVTLSDDTVPPTGTTDITGEFSDDWQHVLPPVTGNKLIQVTFSPLADYPPSGEEFSGKVMSAWDDAEETTEDYEACSVTYLPGDVLLGGACGNDNFDFGKGKAGVVGVRFRNVTVPQDAIILGAHLTFTAWSPADTGSMTADGGLANASVPGMSPSRDRARDAGAP